MKFGLLTYSLSANIGDDIQSLAVRQHVLEDDIVYLDRDHLDQYDGEPCVVVLNGWFSAKPANFPPSDKITPIFFGFHMTPKAKPIYERHKAYFSRHAPIGCRDVGTLEIFKGWGIEAYLSGCATMTFERRPQAPAADQVVIVDVPKRQFHGRERKTFSYLSHEFGIPFLSHPARMKIAGEVIDFYRANAGFVVTSRIHCAMPCSAMGIPTLYVGPSDYRTDVVNQIPVPRRVLSPWRKVTVADLRAPAPSFEDRKAEITADLKGRLRAQDVAVV